jgi:hypothetical protein
MAMNNNNLNRPPAPDWWEVQTFRLTCREVDLTAEEQWIREEQALHFPARCQQLELDYQQQEDELIRQSQDRLRRAFAGNLVYVFRGSKAGRPALTRTSEGINLDREISALKRTFHQLRERDAQWLARQSSVLRLKRAQLEADKQALRDLAASYAVQVFI